MNEQDTTKTAVGVPNTPQLFGGVDVNALCTQLRKSQGKEVQETNQDSNNIFNSLGHPTPVDAGIVRAFKDLSPHHASCIQSKKYSMIGLGFVSDASEIEDSKKKADTGVKDTEDKVQSLLTGEAFIESKVDKNIDDLCMMDFMSELYRAIEDFLDCGTGYLEIVREEGGKIVGVNWLPYEDIKAVEITDKTSGRKRLVYKYTGVSGGIWASITKYYSLFGKDNRQAVYDVFYADQDGIEIQRVSEVIPFMVPSNKCKVYGYPEWLSASTFVTLLAAALQYKMDFYTNRGVLAFILSVAGGVPADKWKEIEKLLQGAVGGGNGFKNLGINLGDPKAKVQIDKLASTDKTELQFAADSEVFAQNIVSAHRVPPVLANILIPGKLGATNEAVQALVSFQLLVIGPYQAMIQKTLARTLGGEDGIEGLDPEDFRLRTITSQFDITGLDAIGRSREEAVATDRDFSEGVKD